VRAAASLARSLSSAGCPGFGVRVALRGACLYQHDSIATGSLPLAICQAAACRACNGSARVHRANASCHRTRALVVGTGMANLKALQAARMRQGCIMRTFPSPRICPSPRIKLL